MASERKITCKTFLDELTDYLDESAAPEIRVSLEAHLAKCPDCWVVYDETKRSVQIVQKMDCRAMPPEVRHRLQSALEAHWKKS